jgi:Zn2+/Cd2+-exporting ATPase
MSLQVDARPLSGSFPGELDATLTGAERERIARRLGSALAAGGFLGAGLLHRWLLPEQHDVAALLLGVGALIAAAPVLRAGWTGFVARDPGSTVEQLVSLALLAAIATGDFETAILVPLIMQIGHFLEERSILGARAAIDGLKTLRPTLAARLGPNGEEAVPVDRLRAGDQIRVRPGQAFPADGHVARGTSAVDQSTMTGESVAEEVARGSQVFAGTLNLSGVLDVEVTALGDATALGRIVELLREAEQSKAPIVRLIESYAEYYLPAVLLVAAAALVLTQDLTRAIAILVVSCPCALILASPAAMTAALAVAARLGILIKSTGFLERLGEIDTLIVDKTGTVTTGQLEVVAAHPLGGLTPDELLAEAGVCAAGSRHPVSRGIRAAAGGVASSEADTIEEFPGRGVVAHRDAAVIRLGSAAWLRESRLRLPAEPNHPGPVVWVARDGDVLGCLLLADRPRAGIRQALRALHGLGVARTLLMTGDRAEVASQVAEELGVDAWLADCLPEEKLAVVEREKAAGRGVMVVGDGVNDALALHGADVGVAMGAMGSDVAVKSADVALMGTDLARLPQMIRLAQETRQVINQNVLLAIGISLLIMLAAGLGLIGPLAGAVVQNVSTFAVVVNSARLLRFEPPVLEEGPLTP